MAAPLVRRARDLVADKLGTCPFCMRTSAWGSVVSWLLVAGAAIASQHVSALVLLVPASAFTLLFLAHLIAYMVRSGLELRRHRRVTVRSWGVEIRDPSRREFLTTMAYAAGYALTISFLGSIPSFAQVSTCTGTNPPVPAGAGGLGGSSDDALADYEAEVLRVCDRFCRIQGCDAGQGCLQDDAKKPVSTPCIPKNLGGGNWGCTGKVKQCTCKCQKCAGQHRPPDTSDGTDPAKDPTYGTGTDADPDVAGDKAKDDARAKCLALCKRFKDCAPFNCLRDGDPIFGDGKSWHAEPSGFGVKIKILKCKCKCT